MPRAEWNLEKLDGLASYNLALKRRAYDDAQPDIRILNVPNYKNIRVSEFRTTSIQPLNEVFNFSAHHFALIATEHGQSADEIGLTDVYVESDKATTWEGPPEPIDFDAASIVLQVIKVPDPYPSSPDNYSAKQLRGAGVVDTGQDISHPNERVVKFAYDIFSGLLQSVSVTLSDAEIDRASQRADMLRFFEQLPHRSNYFTNYTEMPREDVVTSGMLTRTSHSGVALPIEVRQDALYLGADNPRRSHLHELGYTAFRGRTHAIVSFSAGSPTGETQHPNPWTLRLPLSIAA